MTETMDTAPLACTLDSGSLTERVQWIAGLNARALVGARRSDLQLELEYAPAAIDDVRRMIAQEQSCCAFLTFDLAERPDAVRVVVTAPETARDAAEQLFGPFQARAPQKAECGCTGGCGA